MVEVITAYTDKYDGSIHLIGETLELEDKRAKELEKAGFVKIIEIAKATPKKRARKKADVPKE